MIRMRDVTWPSKCSEPLSSGGAHAASGTLARQHPRSVAPDDGVFQRRTVRRRSSGLGKELHTKTTLKLTATSSLQTSRLKNKVPRNAFLTRAYGVPIMSTTYVESGVQVIESEGKVVAKIPRNFAQPAVIFAFLLILTACSALPDLVGVPRSNSKATPIAYASFNQGIWQGDVARIPGSTSLVGLGDSGSVSGSTAELDIGSRVAQVQTICTLGQACGSSDISQQSSNWLITASTYTNQNGWVLSLAGGALIQKGWGIPVVKSLTCATAFARSCTDAQSIPHTCATQNNYVTMEVLHSALLDDDLYTGNTSDERNCYAENGSGEGGSGGTNCYTEWLIIEVWDGLNWVYWGSEPVTLCS